MGLSKEELMKNLEADPEHIGTLIELASLHEEENNMREAVDLLTQVIEIDPENAIAHYDLGVCFLKVLKSDLEVSEIWEDKSDDEEFFELATIAFQRAIEIEPEFVEAYNNLGTLYALRGWNDQAREEWNRSLEIEPDQNPVREDLANL